MAVVVRSRLIKAICVIGPGQPTFLMHIRSRADTKRGEYLGLKAGKFPGFVSFFAWLGCAEIF